MRIIALILLFISPVVMSETKTCRVAKWKDAAQRVGCVIESCTDLDMYGNYAKINCADGRSTFCRFMKNVGKTCTQP